MESISKINIDYQRGYSDGWKECMIKMLDPIIDMEKNAIAKQYTFHGFTVVEDNTLSKGELVMMNKEGEKVIFKTK